ncbi:thiamine pyrophosphate-dependent enzyme [Chloroflexota bacterium]
MSILTIKEKGKKVLATGNEAIARGALEAGVGFVSTYPGTPASEIGDSIYEVREELKGLHFEYSVNEKVAFEGAIGAAWSGIRSLCMMKLPGVNVIADPLHSIGYFGVKGLVFVNGEDPGLQSSATEQDNRWYALHAHFPVLEPSTVQEAKDFTKIGFEISELFGVPCMINIANDLCHGSEILELDELPDSFPEKGQFEGPIVKRAVRNVKLHKDLIEKVSEIAKYYSKSGINKNISGGDNTTGIITSGLPYCYTMEALDKLSKHDLPVLKLGLVHPLDTELIKAFASNLSELIIIEDLEPFLETQIKKLFWDLDIRIKIIGKEIIPGWGALSPDILIDILANYFNIQPSEEILEVQKREKKQENSFQLSERIPTLCIGCPHRGSAYAVKKALKGKGVIGSDIGCYGMLRREPWRLTDWSICMGAGIGIAQGMSHKLESVPLVSFIGDSTFFHSGLEPVLNAAYYDSNMLLIILDNRWTSMTGHQPSPSTIENVTGHPMINIPIKGVLEGLGVKKIFTANPYEPNEMSNTVNTALETPGFKVLISEGECILQTKRRERVLGLPSNTYTINAQSCIQCRICDDYTCPAIIRSVVDDKIEHTIDGGLCVGCGACASLCPTGSIIELER